MSTFPIEMGVLWLKKGETGWQIKTTEVTIGESRGSTWVGDARLETLSCTGHLAGEGKPRTKAFREFRGGPVVRTPSFLCWESPSSIPGLRTKIQGLTKKNKKKDKSIQISEAWEEREAVSGSSSRGKTQRQMPALGRRESRPAGSFAVAVWGRGVLPVPRTALGEGLLRGPHRRKDRWRRVVTGGPHNSC